MEVEPSRKRKRSVSRSVSGSPKGRRQGQDKRSPSPSPVRTTYPTNPDLGEVANQQPKLFITSLAAEVSEDDLRGIFQSAGEIVDICLKSN